MRRRSLAVLTLALASGCGGRPESDPIVPLDQVPGPAMATARKELPGFTFDTAYKMKVEGKDAYETRGKNKQGKIREVEVSATGELLGIE